MKPKAFTEQIPAMWTELRTYLPAEECESVSAIVVNEEPEKQERLDTKIENWTPIDRNISCVRGTFIATAEKRELIECQQE